MFYSIALPAVAGLLWVFLRSGINKLPRSPHVVQLYSATTSWLGSLVLLSVQIGLIWYFGYATFSSLVFIVVLLTAIAVSANFGAGRRYSAWSICAILLYSYVAYWIIVKYLPSPEIYPLFSSVIPDGDQAISSIRIYTIVGVSYIGFKLLHFYLDWRHDEFRKVSVFEFLNWLLFVPSIVAGPMQRFQAWQEQRQAVRVSVNDIALGVQRIVIGLFMKVVLADNLYGMTLPALPDGGLQYGSAMMIASASCLYTVYLYLDFAGYSHIAIGTGMLWGIRLPENFNHPFIARNLSDFWNRWHMSLSSIFKEYIFFPVSIALKRSQKFKKMTVLSAMIPPVFTFIIVGIWHGAGVSFVILGILHGLGIGFLTLMKAIKYQHPIRQWWSRSTIGHVVGSVITFLFVSFTFMFFGLPWSRFQILIDRIF
jgi:membrane protein involved in D-alanine export